MDDDVGLAELVDVLGPEQDQVGRLEPADEGGKGLLNALVRGRSSTRAP